MGEGGEGVTLEYTPTWVVAAVCTVIVAISLGAERLLHYLGRYLKNKKQKSLFEALQKVKEELMLLGFISLLLTVFQNTISKICVHQDVLDNMLPCKRNKTAESEGQNSHVTTTSHFQTFFSSSISGTAKRLLAEEESAASERGYCAQKNKVPLLSTEALHHLHIFIFVLAIVHVTFCVLTILFAGARIRQWKNWEDSIAKQDFDPEQVLKTKVTHVHQHAFIKEHFLGYGKDSALLGWMLSFFKQFYASITKADYVTLRLGFIMCISTGYIALNINTDFLLLTDLLNSPLQLLLLAVGAKLEHVISQLAHEVAEKHIAIEGELVVQPSDQHFWVFIQVLCSYSTLPLYAIVTQMGSSFKKAIFEENVQVGIVGWAEKVRRKKDPKAAKDGSTQSSSHQGVQLGRAFRKASTPEEIQPSTHGSEGSK
ncbi:MLO-like protein 1 [Citrus sinensis]|uniref:MLO-like protein 1 n=1 Tax=Citrus sinensis TaxID=2711 RepID=A0ACB8LC95_CITSI|nr:MLO-like protein 1 [Citrus sinensis]